MSSSLSHNRSSSQNPPSSAQRHASFASTMCALLTVVVPAAALMWVVFPKDQPADNTQPCQWQPASYTPKIGENLIAQQQVGSSVSSAVWQAWCPVTCDATGKDASMPACAIPPLPAN